MRCAKSRGTAWFLTMVVLFAALASCSDSQVAGPIERTGSLASALNASPHLGDFVLYAERSIQLAASDSVSFGDVGVRTAVPSTFGTQLAVGQGAQAFRNLLAPSVSLALNAQVGDVQTSSLQNNGGFHGAVASFPASAMPALPIAPPPGPVGAAVVVSAGQTTILNPGSYGALSVSGTAKLNPGSYSFSTVTVAAQGALVTNGGAVVVNVSGTLSSGRGSLVQGSTADQLTISVSATDGAPGASAVTIGPQSQLTALLSAPHGTLSLGDMVVATGAFAAFDIQAGQFDVITFQTGLSATAVGQHGSQQLAGHIAPAFANLPLVAPVTASLPMSVAVGLPMRDPAGFQTYLKQVSDPKSATYRQYLTLDQITASFGPTAADYQALVNWAQARGLTVTTFPTRTLLDVAGTVAQIESALFINMNRYARADGSTFVAPDREPSLDSPVSVLHVTGLEDFVPLTALNGGGTGQGGAFLAQDLRKAFTFCSTANGKNQSVAVVAFEGFDPTDIAKYQTLSLISPQVPVRVVPVDVPPGKTSLPVGFNDNEVSLDIEMAIAGAPGLSEVVVFEGQANTNTAINTPEKAYVNMLKRIAAATPRSNQISVSYGLGMDVNLQAAIDEIRGNGQTLFKSSGDHGSSDVLAADARSVDGVTVVGGTNLTISGNSISQVAWSEANPLDSSGGGTFNAVPIPAYQVGVDMSLNGGSTQFRNIPDVALVASGIEIVFSQSSINGFVPGTISTTDVGTSFATPLWAGFMARVNEQGALNGAPPLGFFNPLLYQLAQNKVLYAANFTDITAGANDAFHAVSGYDLVTGWGTPKCTLVNQLGSKVPLRLPSSIAGGAFHSCTIRADRTRAGTLDCWGDNIRGELGDNLHERATDGGIIVAGPTHVVSVAANGLSTCALLAEGTVDCWGDDIQQQIGVPTAPANCPGWGPCAPVPVAVTGIAGATAIAVVNSGSACAVVNGGVKCWGFNQLGQLGNGTTTNSATAVSVVGISNATQIAGGGDHVCAVLADGTVRCWGLNSSGQLGNGIATAVVATPTPVVVNGINNAVSIAAGSDFSCAVLATGDVKCWGANGSHQLGPSAGDTNACQDAPCVLTPVTVYTSATAVTGGSGFTCAIVRGGVQCVGTNAKGTLGNGTTISSSTPVNATNLLGKAGGSPLDAVSIGAGFGHVCAVLDNTEVRCWGDNVSADLGTGNCPNVQTAPQSCTPVLVPTHTNLAGSL